MKKFIYITKQEVREYYEIKYYNGTALLNITDLMLHIIKIEEDQFAQLCGDYNIKIHDLGYNPTFGNEYILQATSERNAMIFTGKLNALMTLGNLS